jgi:hypothetical protein
VRHEVEINLEKTSLEKKNLKRACMQHLLVRMITKVNINFTELQIFRNALQRTAPSLLYRRGHVVTVINALGNDTMAS